MNIPLIFWLVLTVAGYGNGTGTSTQIMPVPFGSMEDCQTAAKQFIGDDEYYRKATCLQQRQSDAVIYNYMQGRGDYPQQRPQ